MKKWCCSVCGWTKEIDEKPYMCRGCGVPEELINDVSPTDKTDPASKEAAQTDQKST